MSIGSLCYWNKTFGQFNADPRLIPIIIIVVNPFEISFTTNTHYANSVCIQARKKRVPKYIQSDAKKTGRVTCPFTVETCLREMARSCIVLWMDSHFCHTHSECDEFCLHSFYSDPINIYGKNANLSFSRNDLSRFPPTHTGIHVTQKAFAVASAQTTTSSNDSIPLKKDHFNVKSNAETFNMLLPTYQPVRDHIHTSYVKHIRNQFEA